MLESMLGVLCASSLLQWALGILILCVSVYFLLTAPFRQFPHLPQQTPHWLLGNKTFGGTSITENYRLFYNQMKRHRFSLYWEGTTPCIMVTDLELVKKVQVVDFEHFTDLAFFSEEYLNSTGGVFGMADARGEEWRVLRRLLTPAFSGSRIKKTVVGMNTSAAKMIQHLRDVKEKADNIDLFEEVGKFAVTAIGATAFSIDIDCFKDKNNDFMKHGMKLFSSVWRFIILDLFPKIAAWTKLRFIDQKAENFFVSLAERLVNQRKTSTVESKDILDNLIKASEESSVMTPRMMFQTILQFFGDGIFSFSEITTGILYLLAVYPDVQDRLVEELESALEGKEEILGEDLGNLPYMDQVISEGMRLLAFPFTTRYCTKDYNVPGSQFTIPKGMKVIIPIAGLHHDPEYWPSPDTFDPDRFSQENKSSVRTGAFQPFGSGPRQCIGSNLIKMEAKVMLGHLLRNFRLVPSADISQQLVYDKNKFMGIVGVDKLTIVQRE